MTEPTNPVRGGEEPTSHQTELFWRYLDRINAGEAVDHDELLREHPDLGPEFIRQLEAFQRLASSPDPDLEAPLGILGDYTLRRQIGRGGMGVVYEAWQNSLDRRVALKVLPAGVAVDDRAFQRFMQEAKTAAKLSHPNVVSVYGMGVEQNTPYFAMEFVEGETLAQVLAKLRESQPESETVFGKKDRHGYFEKMAEALADSAEGLQHAHSKGIIHRDIKPSNLILNRHGRLRILDFGLARLEGQESITVAGDVVGTPQYMSPEQARRKKIPVDHRTDVYSLGASLYEMLALEPPFRGKDHEDTLSRIIECDPVEPRKSNPRIPRDLETIVLKCLRKDPADRYGTAESLGQDLRRFARGEPIEARPELPWERWLRRIRRERLKIAIVFLACLSLVALALLGVVQVRAARDMKLGTYRARVQDSLKKLEAAQATLIDPVAADFQGVNMIEFSGAEGRARVEEAVRDLGETTGLLPHLRDAWYHRARALLFLGRMPEAISDLNQAISRDPRFLPPRILKAAILLSSGNLEAAESEIEAARSATGDVSAQTWLGIYQARRWSSWREAESLFTKLIAMEEHGVQSYRDSVYDTRLGRGIARMHLQDYLGAIRDFEVACSRWPDSNEPFVCLGEACYRKGFREEAEQVFEGLYRASPQPSRAALAIAATYHGLKDSASGLKWMERVEDSVARDRLLVGFLAEEGRVKEALVAAERVLQASPHDHLAHRATGIALLGDGKYGQAEDSLRKALEVAPNDLLALHYLGTCLYRQKRFGESRAQYEKIIFRSPGNGYARTALAWIALEEEKLDEAEERVKQAIEVVPEWLEARILLAKILARKRKVDDAIAELEHAFVLARDLADAYPVSEVANAHSLAGWVYLDLGLVGKAEAAFRRSLDLAPGNRDAQEGLDRATSKRGGGGELPIELERSE